MEKKYLNMTYILLVFRNMSVSASIDPGPVTSVLI